MNESEDEPRETIDNEQSQGQTDVWRADDDEEGEVAHATADDL